MIAYRPEVDGLRAVAVSGVVVFHFFPELAPGGFTGVDVFFVISGYLITSIILSEIDGGTFSLLRFYDRRVRRIVPALLAVVAFSFVAAWLLFLPAEFKRFAKSLAAIPAFVTNMVFYREAGYFDSSADIKPLLHTWSRAIEEQFYVLFPIFTFLVARYARSYLLVALVAGCILSFALNVGLISIGKHPAAFFTLPTRAWELLLGAILAELQRKPLRSPPPLKIVAGYAGAALVIAGFAVIEAGTRFPGTMALLPALGATLIIWGGDAHRSGGLTVGSLLSAKPLVWLGLISYSLYLWHWPLLVFAKYYAIEPLAPLQTAIVLVASVAIATASHRLIEQPFRRPSWTVNPRRNVAVGVSGLAVAGLAGAIVLFGNGMPQRFDSAILDLASAAKGAGFHGSPFSTASMTTLAGDPAHRTDVVLWGDSHANAIAPAVAGVSAAKVLSAVMLKRPGCIPSTIDGSPARADCKTYTRDSARWIVEASNARIVILAARWSAYPKWWKDEMAPAEGFGLLERLLTKTVDDLQLAGKTVIVLAEVPSLGGWDVPSVLARIKLYGRDLDIRPSMAGYHERQKPYFALFDRLAQRGATVLYPHGLLCDADKCAVTEDGDALYFDNDHVSVVGARKLMPLFSGLADSLLHTQGAEAAR